MAYEQDKDLLYWCIRATFSVTCLIKDYIVNKDPLELEDGMWTLLDLAARHIRPNRVRADLGPGG
jgi:hypothetical protein